MNNRFIRIAAMMNTRSFYESGYSVKEISDVAKVSQSTVRRWLKVTGVSFSRKADQPKRG